MNILLLGSGGREHALARSLASQMNHLTVVPGNPGIAGCVNTECVDGDILDGESLVRLAQARDIDLVIIGPEAPLVAGVADTFRDAGFDVFGPSATAAQLEGSKAFAKEVMAMAVVPTAMARVCETREQVDEALGLFPAPFVVKDDGLAAGKGVVVTENLDEAREHAYACIDKGRVVIEEFLDGPEVSLFCLSDGTHVVPLAPAQDFKRLKDGGEGPNTGGMGAYSPLPWAPADLVSEVVERVAQPVIDEMARRDTPFVGVLYCGLALTSRGIKVIEFNARFGDPETQVVLPRLKTRLDLTLRAAAQGRLKEIEPLEWDQGAVVTVVLASEGYPGKVVTGRPITEPGDAIHAGTAVRDGQLVTSGGRVMCVMGTGEDVAQARENAYSKIVPFEGCQYRSDIAQGV